jgi:hypothetical protein
MARGPMAIATGSITGKVRANSIGAGSPLKRVEQIAQTGK